MLFVFAGHKLWMFSEHKSFVQGVAFDPLSGFLATLCDDRFQTIYIVSVFGCGCCIAQTTVTRTQIANCI
jgi:hypothetical protein